MEDERLEDTEKDLALTVGDIEEVKERLQNMEFNNEEEDQEMIEESDEEVDESEEKKEEEEVVEEKEEEVKEEEPVEKKEEKEEVSKDFVIDDGKKSNKIIIILSCVTVLLLITVILLLALPKGNNKNNNKGSGNSESSSGTPITDDEKPTISKIDIAEGDSYFINDNYLYVVFKEKGYITNLDGKTYFQDDSLSCSVDTIGRSQLLCMEKDSDQVKYSIKKVDENGEVKTVVEEDKYSSPDRVLKDQNRRLIGIYSENKNELNFYILTNEGSNKITLKDTYLVSNTIYDGRYAIVSKDKSHKSIGLFDVVDNKELIPTKYQEINYLHDNIFAVKENDKYGILDSNGSVKLGHKYNTVYYANGLYFVGTNEVFNLYDSNFKEVKSSLPYGIIEVEKFGDKVIVHSNRSNEAYVGVDKNGKVTKFDFSTYKVYEDTLITVKDNTITLYDKDFHKTKDFTYEKMNEIDFTTGAIYLDNYLVFNGRKLFDIEQGTYLYNANNLSRSYQSYFVNVDIHDTQGDATVSLEDKPIGTLKDIDMNAFINADNNGIKVTNQYFIFHVGNKTLIIKK